MTFWTHSGDAIPTSIETVIVLHAVPMPYVTKCNRTMWALHISSPWATTFGGVMANEQSSTHSSTPRPSPTHISTPGPTAPAPRTITPTPSTTRVSTPSPTREDHPLPDATATPRAKGCVSDPAPQFTAPITDLKQDFIWAPMVISGNRFKSRS